MRNSILTFLSKKEVLPAVGTAVAGAVILFIAFPFLPVWLGALGGVVLTAGTAGAIRNGARLAAVEDENKLQTTRLSRVVEHMKEGVIMYAPDFRITEMNGAALGLFGLTRSVLGKVIVPALKEDATYGLLTQVIYPSLAPFTEQVSAEGWPQIVRLETKSPARKFLTITDRMSGAEGVVTGFIKIIQDETRAEEVETSKTEFVATTAHELRTPLTGIAWAFDTLRSSLTDRKELMDIIEQGSELARRAAKIVNSMLDVAQISGEDMRRAMEPLDLTGVVSDVAREAGPIAESYGVALSFKPEGAFIVSAHPDRIRAAITVLVENALKYNTKNGTVTVELATDGDAAHLTVRDTGVGISEEDRKHLFEKFYRAESAKRVDPNGAGLGLYLAKKIVTAHGGRIWAESISGRGSAFHITLPLS